MAAIETVSIPLGFPAPDFKLLDTISGEYKTLEDFKSDKATLVMFICNHCPYVKWIMDELVSLGNDYLPKGVKIVAISSNDADKYPQDGPDKMKELAEAIKMPYPYLYDETQEVAKAYFAACTPDFSIFDKDLKCVYRGQLDDSRPNRNAPTGKDIRTALDAILAGQPVPEKQIPSIGCNIKWKSGETTIEYS